MRPLAEITPVISTIQAEAFKLSGYDKDLREENEKSLVAIHYELQGLSVAIDADDNHLVGTATGYLMRRQPFVAGEIDIVLIIGEFCHHIHAAYEAVQNHEDSKAAENLASARLAFWKICWLRDVDWRKLETSRELLRRRLLA